ncbi:Homeodomain-like [Phytophthora cactorum]|nr:Homeodomain-like [Phytophthora cactorum]
MHVERSSSIKQKRQALDLVEKVGIEEAARELNIARGTVHGWTNESILSASSTIEYMWKINPTLMTVYLGGKESGGIELERMVQLIAKR